MKTGQAIQPLQLSNICYHIINVFLPFNVDYLNHSPNKIKENIDFFGPNTAYQGKFDGRYHGKIIDIGHAGDAEALTAVKVQEIRFAVHDNSVKDA